MDWPLIAFGIVLFSMGLAIGLPRGRIGRRRDRSLAMGAQAAGGLAMAGGSLWVLWLAPQLMLTAGCAIASGVLTVLTLFTVTLPCHTSLLKWMGVAEGLVAMGLGLLSYGTTRRMVIGQRARVRVGVAPPATHPSRARDGCERRNRPSPSRRG